MSYVVEDSHGTGAVVSAGVAGTREDTEFFGELGPDNCPLPITPAGEILRDVQAFTGRYWLSKRAMDVVGSLAGLVVLGPVMLLAMLFVFLRDFKNPLFLQKRVGLDGEQFTLFKIRTMCVDAERRLDEIKHLNHHDDDKTFKVKNDPRIIPVIGERLRRYSIDEFPQLFNVLMGDMSLVGPRPALPNEVELYTSRDRLRLAVKPGLTCIWQVSGRGNIPFHEQLKLDLQYIDECSLSTDVKLIAKTLPAMMNANGAH